MLLDCIRQIKDVCEPTTQRLKDLKLAKHMIAADRLGQNTLIVPADKLQVFLQAACEANKQNITQFTVRKLDKVQSRSNEVLMELVRSEEFAESVDAFKKPSNIGNCSMVNPNDQTYHSTV